VLEGKVAIVTGGGRGIGRATALQLAKLGAAVLLNDYGVTTAGTDPDAGPAQEAVAEITAAGGRAAANGDSVATEEGANRIIENCLEVFGKVDILVNNAGIITPNLFTDIPTADFDRMLAVHLKGAWGCTQAAVPHMIRQGRGRVINLTSSGGLFGIPSLSHYGMAKAGIMGFTFVLARELKSQGITVNAIAPGAQTRMSGRVFPDNARAVMEAWGFGAAGRVGGAEQVAAVIAYLGSDAAAEITGQLVSILPGVLGIWSPPAIDHTVAMPGGWVPEAVAAHLPALVQRAGSSLKDSRQIG
jgi:NAD(P)-dependent dehydrogenase (short-subunit alcohol dehydrogenase family)